MKLTRSKISSRAHAIKQAKQTINKTLATFNDMDIFSQNRMAELQAVAVILARAESDIWEAYDKFTSSD